MGIQLILLPEEMPTNFLENKSLHQKHVKIVKIFSGEKTENNTYVAAFILVQLYSPIICMVLFPSPLHLYHLFCLEKCFTRMM